MISNVSVAVESMWTTLRIYRKALTKATSFFYFKPNRTLKHLQLEIKCVLM